MTSTSGVDAQSQSRRAFVIVGHTQTTSPDFPLNDLPGSAGRMDILARCVTAAFCLSHGLRKDVEVFLVLRDEVVLRFEGARLKRLNPDERSTGALLKHALQALREGRTQSTPGVSVARRGLSEVLQELEERGFQLYVLDERGEDIRTADFASRSAFVLSDHRNFTPEEEVLLQEHPKLSLGPVVLHADHCIPLVHNELDRRFPPEALE